MTNPTMREKIAEICEQELLHEDTYSDLEVVECEKTTRCFKAIAKLLTDAILAEIRLALPEKKQAFIGNYIDKEAQPYNQAIEEMGERLK